MAAEDPQILFACGECTVTLEDVAQQLGLPINENATAVWSTNLSIGRSYTVSIYHLIIENHAREGIVEGYHDDRILWQFSCIQYILTLPVRLGKIHGMNRRGKHGNDWGEVHEEYIMIWNNRLGRVP
ncbi:hypothetical protein J1N35_001712 [Gossypium stocksii]|uniref:Uncharacterized protein n=1 Tax=Gossypium stocksii TaxID=47602 RepID=A0A9D3WKL6_9ROSI|nr:hypothetical protein J1N35_001712 [Gossypium stocksii]